MGELNLTTEDLAAFAKLGIPPGLLALAGIVRVSDYQARDEYGIIWDSNVDCSGLIFPYIRNGRRVTCRLRRDNPEVDYKGKPVAKYISPRGDNRHAYIFPGDDELLENTSIPVIVCEAEKSVLAVKAWTMRTNVKQLAISCGGCWGFLSNRGTDNVNE
jgi:hypothetical protein